jgi:peroxiredoxin Q/BCP
MAFMLSVQDKAPDFTLQDQEGAAVSLSDFLGKWVVLYFYPRDSTPGCTRQACAFAAADAAFAQEGAVVLGVSKDSQASHLRFAQKNDLPFRLLSDPERQVIEAYGVWQEKKLYGKTSMGVVRTTYLIDPQGKIAAVMEKVKPDANAQEVLEKLRSLKKA